MPWFLALLGSVGSAAGGAASAIGSAASGLGSAAAGLGQGALSGLTSAGAAAPSAAGAAGGGAGAAGGLTAAIPTGAGGLAGASSFGSAGSLGGLGGAGGTAAGLTPGLTAGSGLAGGLQSAGGALSSFGQGASNLGPSFSQYLQNKGPVGRIANTALGGESQMAPGGGQPPSMGESVIGGLLGKVLGGGPGSQLQPEPMPSGPIPRRQPGQLRSLVPRYNDFITGSLYGNNMLQNGLLRPYNG